MTKSKIKLNFIDLFSGAGGLSCGLELAGMNCVLGVDMDKNAIETFKNNHLEAEAFCGSILDLSAAKIKELTKSQTIHAVVGGPPCQGFSTVGLGNPNDQRNHLFKEFIRVVKITNPYFVVIENVTGLLAKKNEKTIQSIFKIFAKMGYSLDVQVMSAENYGVPERRRRTIIIGSRINQTITFPKMIPNIVTVGQALKNLKAPNGKYFNHDVQAAKIKSTLETARIACIPEGKGVRYEIDEKNYFKTKKLKLNVDWKNLRENRFRQTKYQRLDRKKPSPTIMTHRHNYFHPTENRYLTQREAAALQSFPNDFKFHGPLSAQWRQIGNAVPPLLGKAIGSAIIEMHNEKVLSKPAKIVKTASKDLVMNVRKKAFVYKEIAAS
ncbi:MAG: DNA cytosine methyltransferase [Bacteriovorax sp.]|nr:DNA cytosine methyltransferase [Bacteriovorax sp.]